MFGSSIDLQKRTAPAAGSAGTKAWSVCKARGHDAPPVGSREFSRQKSRAGCSKCAVRPRKRRRIFPPPDRAARAPRHADTRKGLLPPARGGRKVKSERGPHYGSPGGG